MKAKAEAAKRLKEREKKRRVEEDAQMQIKEREAQEAKTGPWVTECQQAKTLSEAPLTGAPSIHLRSLSPEGNVIGVDQQIDDSENEKISLFDMDGLGNQTLAIGYSKSIIEGAQEIVSLHVMRKNPSGRNLFDREIVSGPYQDKIEGGGTYVSFSSNFRYNLLGVRLSRSVR
jgi:hypothetical protein